MVRSDPWEQSKAGPSREAGDEDQSLPLKRRSKRSNAGKPPKHYQETATVPASEDETAEKVATWDAESAPAPISEAISDDEDVVSQSISKHAFRAVICLTE